MIYEQLLKHDPAGVGIMFRAFNRWMEEDWGFVLLFLIFFETAVLEDSPATSSSGKETVTAVACRTCAFVDDFFDLSLCFSACGSEPSPGSTGG